VTNSSGDIGRNGVHCSTLTYMQPVRVAISIFLASTGSMPATKPAILIMTSFSFIGHTKGYGRMDALLCLNIYI